VLDFAHLVAQRAGAAGAPAVTGEYRFGDTRHIGSAITRLRALGWAPRGTLQGNIDEYLGWAASQPGFRNYADEARAHMRQVGAVRRGQGQG
jgi:dTDP-L-rhamnose 4-epimerase